MLCHKSWLETLWGFASALMVVLVFSLWSVLRFPDAMRAGLRDMLMHHHPNAVLRGVATYTQVEIFDKLAILWAILSVMLGTGGLLRETRLGTAPFLLSLPTSRVHLVGARCAVSVLEASGLALAAYAMVPLAFPEVHQRYSWGLALRYALILAVSGICFAVFGILISVVLEGGAWPAIIGASAAFLSLVLGEIVTLFSRYAPFPVLSGESYFRYGIVPWGHASGRGMVIHFVATPHVALGPDTHFHSKTCRTCQLTVGKLKKPNELGDYLATVGIVRRRSPVEESPGLAKPRRLT
jgi:hypothetical protein